MAIYLDNLTRGDAIALGQTLRSVAVLKSAPLPIQQMLLRLGDALIGSAEQPNASELIEAAIAWAKTDVAADVAADHMAQLVRETENRGVSSIVRVTRHGAMSAGALPANATPEICELHRKIDNAACHLENVTATEQSALSYLRSKATAMLPTSEQNRRYEHGIAQPSETNRRVS